MARHNPPEPGRRPRDTLTEPSPTCHRCTWVFRIKSLLWELKFLSAGCAVHRGVPDDLSQPAMLDAWLTAS
jgi:hypothetical protein